MKKQSSGLYRTKVTIGHDSKGKPIVKWISAKTKRELEDKKRATIEYYITGTGAGGEAMFKPYAEQWLRAYKANKAPATYLAYSNVINNQLIPAFGVRHLQSISATEIQLYMNTLSGRSASMINRISGTLNAIFKCAIRDRLITHNPASVIEKPEAKRTKEKPVLTSAQRKSIEKALDASQDGLFTAVLYYTGVRIGEACGLQWGDINWKDGLIHIQRGIDHTGGNTTVGKLKTKSSDRYIPIAPQLLELLRSVPTGLPSAFIFTCRNGLPVSYTHARNMFGRTMLSAGLAHRDDTHNIVSMISPHALRHNFVTLCYEKGIDAFTASKLAGHSTPKITMEVYTHLSKEHLQDLSPVIAKIFG